MGLLTWQDLSRLEACAMSLLLRTVSCVPPASYDETIFTMAMPVFYCYGSNGRI